MKIKKLEKITWNKGEFLNEKGEVVNPIPIGAPIIILRKISELGDFEKEGRMATLQSRDSTGGYRKEEVNAYQIEENPTEEYNKRTLYSAISFYKI